MRRSLRLCARTSALLIAAVFLTGCAELPASAKQQKLDAEVAYRNADYRGAVGTLDTFLARYPNHREAAEAYYLRALCHAKQSNKCRAASDAQQCIRVSAQSDLTAKAHAMAGALLYESGKESAALSHFAKALRSLPEEPPTDLVRYRYALCLQHEGHWKEARLEFAAVFQRYPSSTLAAHAKRMYDWPHDYFSIQCGAFREKSGAKKLLRKINSAGLKGRIESRLRSGEVLQMVYVGKYPRHDRAQDALSAVRRQVPGSLIVP
jgi:TolA-binding protein